MCRGTFYHRRQKLQPRLFKGFTQARRLCELSGRRILSIEIESPRESKRLGPSDFISDHQCIHTGARGMNKNKVKRQAQLSLICHEIRVKIGVRSYCIPRETRKYINYAQPTCHKRNLSKMKFALLPWLRIRNNTFSREFLENFN